jgi:hypothetical protein
MAEGIETVVLWLPTGPKELALVEASVGRSGHRRCPSSRSSTPFKIEEYAAKTARDWIVPASGSGYVTRFNVRKSFLDHSQVRGQSILEYWIPAKDLSALNASMIELVAEYH